jgi:cobalt-zinc-cadmium efflux system outer membrane protein
MRCAIRTAFTVMVFAGLPAIQAQTPLSIEDAVSQALLNRPELRAASERLIASKHLQTQAKLLPNPRFYFQTEDLRASNFDFAKDSETYAYASELIETSGRRRARTGVAAQEVQRNRVNADRLTAQVATRVRHAYWSAQSAQLLLRLYTEDAGYYRQIIAYHEARFREGKLAEIDILRLKLEGERVRSAAAGMELTAGRALLNLADEIGSAALDWKLTESFEELEQPKPIPPNTDPVSRRPEGEEAHAAIEVARANVALQRSMGRPDVEVLAGYKANLGQNTAIAGMQFTLPLFDRNQGGIAAAQANTRAAEEDYAAVHRQLSSELKLAERDYAFQRDEYEKTFKPLHEQAIAISDITRSAYREGGVDLIRLLDAERLRVEAEVSWVNALESYHQSVVTLEYAEGVQP